MVNSEDAQSYACLPKGYRFSVLTISILLFIWLAFLIYDHENFPSQGKALLAMGLLASQIILGITNVLFDRPIIISLFHNLTALCLLLSIIAINFNINEKNTLKNSNNMMPFDEDK